MSILLHVRPDGSPVAEKRRELAQSVIKQFGSVSVESSLLCYLDDQDYEPLKTHFGKANRGFYKPLKGGPHGINGWYLLPDYVKESILVEDDSYALHQAADHLIYLYGSTCANETALVMTFAHELQHFVQYRTSRELWAASTVLLNMKKDFYPSAGVKVFDIPAELEARIVAKKVTQKLCGAQAVNSYIENRIVENSTPEDGEDWGFVKNLDTKVPFDLLTVSKKTFNRLLQYRTQIEETLALANEDSDFRELELSPLFDG